MSNYEPGRNGKFEGELRFVERNESWPIDDNTPLQKILQQWKRSVTGGFWEDVSVMEEYYD